MIAQYEGKEPPSLEIFLKLVGLTKEQFYEITKKHIVSPWKISSVEHEIGEKLPDFSKWSIDGAMDINQSKQQINKWDSSFKC